VSILTGLDLVLAAKHGLKTVAAADIGPNNPAAPDTIVFVPDALLNGVPTPALVVDTGSVYVAYFGVTTTRPHYLDTGANGQGTAITAVSPGAYSTLRSYTIMHSVLQNRKYDLLQHVSGNNLFYYYFENNSHQVYYTNASGVGGGLTAPAPNRAGANAGRLTVDASGNFTFYDSIDGGVTFQALGAAVAAAPPMIYSAPIQIGGVSASVNWAVQRVTFVSDDAVALDIDFTTLTTGQTSITAAVGGTIALQSGAVIN
jgi:hypothetical protein